jgi:hypothetical protein
VRHQTSADGPNQDARALDALQEAREMPPGAQRTEAIEKAGLLRHAADSHGLTLAKLGSPRNNWLQRHAFAPHRKASAKIAGSRALADSVGPCYRDHYGCAILIRMVERQSRVDPKYG